MVKIDFKELFSRVKLLPQSKYAPVALDILIITVSGALVLVSVLCTFAAIRYAVTDLPTDTIYRSMENAIDAAAGELEVQGGEMWFMLADGTFVNGNNELFAPTAPAQNEADTPLANSENTQQSTAP